jgi:phosphoribosyl-ATP pyrophosphohydrolase
MKMILKMLWDSTANFHKRFNKFPPILNSALYAFREEVKEVEYAAEFQSNAEICEEIADAVVTMFGLAMAKGIGFKNIEDAIATVLNKNNAKNRQTHVVDNVSGKIRRRNVSDND